jgi:DeoR/GlpR family transcriptional regulator of sugar metabolism
MRLYRLLGIIMLLNSRGIMKAGALAKILETSERTIYRDMNYRPQLELYDERFMNNGELDICIPIK